MILDTDTISVVIPTRRCSGKPLTTRSIPGDVATTVVYGDISPAGKSRNCGARNYREKEILLFADDDIRFEWSEVMAEFAKGFSEGYDVVSIHGSRLMALSRAAFDKIGGFDDDLKWWEDHDFLLRAVLQGLTIKRLPWSLVKHEGTWRSLKWFAFWSQTNVIWFISKHGYFPDSVFVPEAERKLFHREPRLIRPRDILLKIERGLSPSWLLIRQLFRWIGFYTQLIWRVAAWLR